MTIAAALQLALTLGPAAESLAAQLWDLLHGGARGTDPAPDEVAAEIAGTQARMVQAELDAADAEALAAQKTAPQHQL